MTETRVVSSTGGEKGQKRAQVGAVDPRALVALGEVAGHGTKKYSRYNFMRGYDWSLSFDALQRHLLAFWGGEDLDPESGLPHVAHAMWHCAALHSFSLDHPEFDDRPGVEKSISLAEVFRAIGPADDWVPLSQRHPEFFVNDETGQATPNDNITLGGQDA